MIKKTLLILVALCLVTVSAGCISSGDTAESSDAGGILGLFGDGAGGMSENLMEMALSQGDMSDEDRAMLESLMSGDYASLMQGDSSNADYSDDSYDEYMDYSNLMQGMDYSSYYGMGSDPYSAAYSESGMNENEMNDLMSLLSGGAGGYSSLDILTAGDDEAMEGMTEEEMAMLEQYLSSYGGLF